MSNERFFEEVSKDWDEQEKRILKSLTIVAMTGTLVFIFLYLFYIQAYASVLFNLALIPLYLLSFLFIRLNLYSLSRYWSIWLFQIQIVVYSFYFFDRTTGFHVYFLVIPFLCIMVHHYKLTVFKILTGLSSVALFFLKLISDFQSMNSISSQLKRRVCSITPQSPLSFSGCSIFFLSLPGI